jgi:hypothetical protein
MRGHPEEHVLGVARRVPSKLGTRVLLEALRTVAGRRAVQFEGSKRNAWPDLWTQRTRPQVSAKPQTVSHSSHTPHRGPHQKNGNPEPLRIIQ